MNDLIRPLKPNTELIKEELDSITFDELNEYQLSPGHVYHLPKLGKPRKILHAGEVINDSLVSKLVSKGVKDFHIQKAISYESVGKIRKIIKELEDAKYEDERLIARQAYLEWFRSLFWTGASKGSFLDLICTLNKILFSIPKIYSDKILNESLVVYHRGFRVASLVFSFALICGYLDYKYLKELYNTCFLLDYGLFKNGFSYNVLVALNKERKTGGEGVGYLSEVGASDFEVQAFLHHSSYGLEDLADLFELEFSFPELGSLIYSHHEIADGTGFPLGVTEGEMLEIESIVGFVDHLVPVDSFHYSETDAQKLIGQWINEMESSEYMNKAPSKRILRIVKEFLNKTEEAA